MCATSATAAVRSKYGKYLPHQRANVDQVPLPFVNDMETTYEQVGEKRVAARADRLRGALVWLWVWFS